ncbi:male accessory gland serine protease inhibitor [Drosophila erecta]|uniref:BPTI/Kunitz inhibitor domain-containing protein n=1 Tax=Drosophila erecta TaxID=7220 RepID=B3N362_DROER|nr:male accessory gland serine protease inhibitor [Drosophila erecta]XP_026835136.1 male accessory gland serine protease inhibitor [Drosophila erecta]EDV57661.1 uncharacterized protein Dere_GG24412 [Drosophila erecta]EDV57663.1 uncharacterized protein Dere_GG24409 [Drosophila erecta]
MKFIAAVCLMFALLGVTLGLKDPICGQPAAKDGNGLIKCAAFMPSFSYYPESNSCEKFIYGGCGGNENRFGTKESCEEKCLE